MVEVNEIMLDFYKKLRPRNKNMDMSSFDNFINGIGMDGSTAYLANSCRDDYSKRKYYDKSVTSVLSYNLHAFVNDFQRTKKILDYRQRMLRTLVLEYYFDGYIDTMLVPFLDKNKVGDINRARNKLAKTKILYPDQNNSHHLHMVEQAELKLKDTEDMYNYDWGKDFFVIKQIKTVLKSSEDDKKNVQQIQRGLVMDKDIKEFLDSIVNEPSEYDLSNWENFVKALKLSATELHFMLKCKYLDKTKDEDLNISAHLLRFAKIFSETKEQLDYATVRYFKLRSLLVDYYYPEFIDEYLKPIVEHATKTELSRAKELLDFYKNRYESTNDKKIHQAYFSFLKKYNNAEEVYSEDWMEHFATIRKLTNTIKDNENQVYIINEQDDTEYKILEDDNVKSYFEQVTDGNTKIDMSSLNAMLKSIGVDTKIDAFRVKCEKYYDPQGLSKTRKLFNDYSRVFVNNKVDTNTVKHNGINDRQRLITLVIMDYYHPDFIDTYLKPFLYRSKDGDINRARANMQKVFKTMNDENNPIHKNLREKAQQAYEYISSIYNTDWDKNFATVKQINAELHKNEVFSNIKPNVVNSGV